jgi:transaldolase
MRCAARRTRDRVVGRERLRQDPSHHGRRVDGSACRELSEDGVKVNVTALFTTAQVELITAAVKDGAPSYISVFAGRIADAGIDPVPIMARAVDIMVEAPRSELIWASPREVLNVIQADQVGCHIITVTHDLLKKLDLLGKDLLQYSLETVQMFHRDALAAGFTV